MSKPDNTTFEPPKANETEFSNNEDAASNASLWSGDLDDIATRLQDNELTEALQEIEDLQEKLGTLHAYVQGKIE